MKMILSLKSAGSHCSSPILFRISLMIAAVLNLRESSTRTPSAFHQFDSVRRRSRPLNTTLPGLNRIGSRSSQAQHRVWVGVVFGSGVLMSSTVQQTRPYPPSILGVNQVYTSGLCLTTDQLFCIREKLSCSSPRRILYISQIHVMVISEMNCCSESGIHESSPYGHIHVQIFHRIACWS